MLTRKKKPCIELKYWRFLNESTYRNFQVCDDPMQSQAKTVPAYLKEVPAERKAALKQLRDLCRLNLTGFKESMDYGGPCYARNGEVVPYGDDKVGFMSQKHFIGLYTLRVRTDVMKTHKHLLKGKGISHGKGCIRYSKPERIDFKVVEKMLKDTEKSIGPVC